MAQVGTKALVSSEDGIYSSTNAGLTWSIETTNSLITPIYEFLQISGYIFGLCNKSIVVSDDSYISFSQVYYAEKDLFSLQVYNSELYVIEGRDVLKSSSYIFFTPIEFAKIGISNVIPKTLLAVDDSLYVGGEEIFAEYNFLSNSVVHKYFTTENCTKFFIAENSTFTKDFSRKEKFARVYYSSSGNYCYTLDYTNDDKIFSAAIQFDYFGRKDGGWIQNTFDATAEIYQNRKFIENIVGPANITTTALIASLNEGLTTASAISADNSNYTIASDYISEFGASIAKIQTSTESSVELYQNVEDSVRLYDKMYSKMNYPVKYFESLIINGTNFTGVNGHIIFETSAPTYFSDYALVPSLSLKNTGTNHIADIGTGSIFLQGTSSDQFEIAVHNGNIIDLGVNTHKQIDDAIELSSSGLTFNMMESFADALGKTGLAIHNNFDTFENKPIQGENILFTKQHQYDVLNSTIKYSLLTSNFAAENKLIFPNDVYASEDFAYIATTGGIQVVDLTTFVSSFEEFEEDIYGIRVLSGTIYCFSRTSVYDFATKEKVELYGLTGTIYDVAFFGTSLLIATSTGTFLKYSSETVCNLVQDVANSVGSKLFVNKFSFLYSGGNFYSSSNGINWTLLGAISQQRFFEFVSFKNVSWIATSRGLRSDFSNFYSGGVATSLIDLMSDPYLSEALIMNCVASDGTYLCAGDSSGVLYLVDELGIFSNSNLGIGAIYKVIFSGTNILAFGANCIKVVPISSIATGTVVIFENGVPL
jgi:hypothetical protein